MIKRIFAFLLLELATNSYADTALLGKWKDKSQPENYQYEFAYSALKSEMILLEGGAKDSITFYALYEDDHAGATTQEDLSRCSEI